MVLISLTAWMMSLLACTLNDGVLRSLQSSAKVEAARLQREELDSQVLETRKAEAAARLALQDKIRAGTVTASEMDAAGY